MTTCGVIQVRKVRIFRELRTYTHSTILNILSECVTHIFLSILLMNTCGMAYFLPGKRGKNTQRMSYKCDYTCILSSYVCSYVCALTHFPPVPLMTTCGMIQVYQVRISRELHTCVYVHTLVWHNSFSFLPHKHLFGGLCNTYQVHQVRTHTGSATNYSILNIIHKCVKHSFLYPPSSTPGAYFLSGYPGKNIQRAPYLYTFYHPKHTPWVCDTHFLLYSP